MQTRIWATDVPQDKNANKAKKRPQGLEGSARSNQPEQKMLLAAETLNRNTQYRCAGCAMC
jgi:hypothetical protein